MLGVAIAGPCAPSAIDGFVDTAGPELEKGSLAEAPASPGEILPYA